MGRGHSRSCSSRLGGAAVKLMWAQSLCLVMGVMGVSPSATWILELERLEVCCQLPNVSHQSVSHFEKIKHWRGWGWGLPWCPSG